MNHYTPRDRRAIEAAVSAALVASGVRVTLGEPMPPLPSRLAPEAVLQKAREVSR